MKPLLISFALSIFIIINLLGCSVKSADDVSMIKSGYLEFDKSLTTGQALDGYKYFKTKSWKPFVTEQGRRIVEFTGVVDMDNPDIKNNISKALYDASVPAKFKFYSVRTAIQFVINQDNTFKIQGISVLGTQNDGKTELEKAGIMEPNYLIQVLYQNNPVPGYLLTYN